MSRTAGVAIIARQAAEQELLFVRRVRRRGDPWSGDMAFPGGFAHAGETGLDAARRETREEVGLELGEPVGRLSDRRALRSITRPFAIEPWLFEVQRHPPLKPEPSEIAEIVWLGVSELRRPPTLGRQWLGPIPILAPTRRVQGYRIWGLTGAILDELFTYSSRSS